MVLNGLYEKHSNANSVKRGKEINLKKKINNFADKFWKPLKPIPASQPKMKDAMHTINSAKLQNVVGEMSEEMCHTRS